MLYSGGEEACSGWSSPRYWELGSHPMGVIIFRLVCGYLSFCSVSLHFGQHQTILLGTEVHVCEQFTHSANMKVEQPVFKPVTSHFRVQHSNHYKVSNRSAGIISSRFPGDIFTKIHQNLQFYRHLPGRVTNPWDHTDPVYPSNSSVKGHLREIDSPNINPGLLQDAFYWYTVKYKNFESDRKFPVDFANFQ